MKVLIAVMSMLVALAAPAGASAAEDVVIVYDASGSMWGQINDVSKIEIARDVLGDLVGGWAADTNLGLIAYGHRREADCGDIQTLISPGPLDAEAFMRTVSEVSPKGRTPLTAAVQQAAEVLSYEDRPATVVLISDGVENCEADPCALASQLERAAELLDALRAEADERLQSVPKRLDAALLDLERVAALNSDDVGTVRRILSHLDSQRDALPRLSPGLQLQLEASLSSAERLLEKLQGEFEATRLVADELVSGGLLDGVLGLFRTGSEDGSNPQGLVDPAGALSSSPQAQLEAFLAEEGVTAAAVLDASGELVAGRLANVVEGVPALRAAAAAVAGSSYDSARLVTVELKYGVVMIGWLANGDCIVLEIADTSELSILTNRLRRRLHDLDDEA